MHTRSTAVRREYVWHDNGGHWCNRCRLGTGYRIWVWVANPFGTMLQTWLWCSECEGRDVTVDPDIRVA